MREMRSSVVFLGAILARTGEATLSAPGGCELGPRPIDLHLAAMREFGARVEDGAGRIIVTLRKSAKNSDVRHISFSLPSVGATENSMLLAAGTPGKTIITNAAREPEIEDLQDYLRKLGVSIHGAGTPMITIERTAETVKHSIGRIIYGGSADIVEHTIIPDRIVAATYLAAVASAGGFAELNGPNPAQLEPIITSLQEMGCKIDVLPGKITIARRSPLKAGKPIITKPYPGFPTDAQPPMMAACVKADGTTVFVENIFENRYRHVEELKRLSADIKVEGKTAIVCGVKTLFGAEVEATDLRGGAALIVAALGARGESLIGGMEHVNRGYENITAALSALGADVNAVYSS
jgi:UDP-N-acetylglucosamine 1-carboxyvinyltransferase